MASQKIEWQGAVTGVDQYDNPTVATEGGTACQFKLSQYSEDVDNYQVGDLVRIIASKGRSGDWWIDTLENLSSNRGKRPPPRRGFRRNGNGTAQYPAATPDQPDPRTPIEAAGSAITTQFAIGHSQARVMKAAEIAFDYLRDDGDADESDAFALADRIIKWMEQHGA